MTRLPSRAVIFALLPFAVAQAQPAPSSIEISHAWARAIPGVNGAVYVTIINHGTVEDRVTGVETPVAETAGIHISQDENGVMKMRALADLPLKAGATVTLQPGGLHIMLMGLKQKLVAGTSFPLTLRFEKAGPVTTSVAIEKPGGMTPGMKM